MKLNLTTKSIQGLKSDARENYFDTDTRGLVLRVGPRRKTWYFTYRAGGPMQWLRLGEFPELELAKARKAARDARGKLDDLRDPKAEQVIERAQNAKAEADALAAAAPAYTFGDFIPVFVAFQKGRIKEWKADENKIEKWLRGPWEHLPLNLITRRHVAEVLDQVTAAGLTTGVNRVQAVISRLFSVALDRQLIDHHPAVKVIKRFPEHAGERVLSDAEIRALFQGCDKLGTAASDVIKLRLILGQRGGETLGMLRSELELEDGVWEMPAARTKNKIPQVVALPPMALAIIKRHLEALPDEEPRVFPALSRSHDDFRDLAALAKGFVWKDLRRTISTRLAALGFSTEVIDKVTNHKRPGVTARHYNKHRYLAEVRDALTAWDRALARILAGKPMVDAKVVPMRRRK